MVFTYKSGGELDIPDGFKQNKQEQEKNIKAYEFLAREYGERYRLLGVSNQHGVKNPDALNLATNQLSDAKMPTTTNGKNAIQNSIKEASKQHVQEVYVYLEHDFKMYDIWLGIKAALLGGRAASVETIVIRMRSGEVKRYSVSKLRSVFHKSRGKA
jgi:hypothetical protein